jgi:predicted RNase H-like HicB family nuclease
MGQLVEWPEVITEGRTLEECRASLRDALHEMIQAYLQLGKEIPQLCKQAGLKPKF